MAVRPEAGPIRGAFANAITDVCLDGVWLYAYTQTRIRCQQFPKETLNLNFIGA